MFYLRVANMPEYYTADDLDRFFAKRAPGFKSAKMVHLQVSANQSDQPCGNLLIQTNDVNTVEKLLSLHGRKFDGFPLSCWLMGHEHVDNDTFNQ
jgi:hypothetical protein